MRHRSPLKLSPAESTEESIFNNKAIVLKNLPATNNTLLNTLQYAAFSLSRHGLLSSHYYM
jgi:hypothetical protein